MLKEKKTTLKSNEESKLYYNKIIKGDLSEQEFFHKTSKKNHLHIS